MDETKDSNVVEAEKLSQVEDKKNNAAILIDYHELSDKDRDIIESRIKEIQIKLDDEDNTNIKEILYSLTKEVELDSRNELLYHLIRIALKKQEDHQYAYAYFRTIYEIRYMQSGKDQVEGVYPSWNQELQFVFSLYDGIRDLIRAANNVKDAGSKVRKKREEKFTDTKKRLHAYIVQHADDIVKNQNKILFFYNIESLIKIKQCEKLKSAKADGLNEFISLLDNRIKELREENGMEKNTGTIDKKKEESNSTKETILMERQEPTIDIVNIQDVGKPEVNLVEKNSEPLTVEESQQRIEDREVNNDADRVSVILELSLTGDFDRLKEYLESIAYEQGTDTLIRIIRATLMLSSDDRVITEQLAKYVAYASTESEENSFDTFKFLNQILKNATERRTQEFILIVFDNMSKYGHKGCKEARMYKKQLNQVEISYQEKLCNNLSKPLAKIEQTMVNLRNQEKPAKEVIGILMDQMAGIHYALEECGVESVASINKWIEQTPSTFDSTNYSFDSAVVADPTKPVVFKSIGMKAKNSNVIIKAIVKPVEEGAI